MDIAQIVSRLIENGFGVSHNGNINYEVNCVCDINTPTATGITYYSHPFYDTKRFSAYENCSVITSRGIHRTNWASHIITDNPKEAFAVVANMILGSRISTKNEPIIGIGVTFYGDIATIGVPGIGYVWWKDKKYMMPQIGDTLISDGCIIGANVTICRGALRDTVLKSGVIVGHGATIGHGCIIGSDSFIGNNSVICGSVEIRERCWIAPNVTVNPGIRIGENSIISSGSVVTCDVYPYSIMAGTPAKKTGNVEKGVKYNGMPKY